MVGKLKDDCQKYTECILEQVLKSYLYQWRVCPGFPGSWRRMLYLMKPKENNTRFKIVKRFRYLLSKQNHTWRMGDGGGGMFWRFSSSSDWCSGVSWLWGKNMISIQIKWSHKGFKFSYLLKRKKEDWLEHLFEVLLLLKIGWRFFFLTSSHLGVRYFVFSPSGHIYQSWRTIADIRFIGW